MDVKKSSSSRKWLTEILNPMPESEPCEYQPERTYLASGKCGMDKQGFKSMYTLLPYPVYGFYDSGYYRHDEGTDSCVMHQDVYHYKRSRVDGVYSSGVKYGKREAMEYKHVPVTSFLKEREAFLSNQSDVASRTSSSGESQETLVGTVSSRSSSQVNIKKREMREVTCPTNSKEVTLHVGNTTLNSAKNEVSPSLSSCSSTSFHSKSIKDGCHGTATHERVNSEIGNTATRKAMAKSCTICLSLYSSGNWYRHKDVNVRGYMCKSCYVCVNRRLKVQKIDVSAAISSVLESRERRKPRNVESRMEMLRNAKAVPRECCECYASFSSGDWYRDPLVEGGVNCQRCYQRKKKLKKNAAAASVAMVALSCIDN